jgi:hypothetical protein
MALGSGSRHPPSMIPTMAKQKVCAAFHFALSYFRLKSVLVAVMEALEKIDMLTRKLPFFLQHLLQTHNIHV